MLFTPEKVNAAHPAIFVVRDGSWRQESFAPMHCVAGELAEHGYITAVANYPANAKNAFEQLSALRGLYQRFQAKLQSMGLSSRIAVVGVGAGGHLGSLLTCTAPEQCGEDFSSDSQWIPPVGGCFFATPVRFTPWPELGPQLWSAMQEIAGASYEEHPEIYERLSLVNYLSNDALPPLFFADGEEAYSLYPHWEQVVVEELKARGKIAQWRCYPLAAEGFMSLAGWKPQQEAIRDILEFCESLSIEKGTANAALTIPDARNYGIYLDKPLNPKRCVDIFRPPEGVEIADTALFIIHGGGWRFGDRSKFHAIAESFANHGIITATAGYRQNAPATAFDMLADVREDYDVFIQELEKLGRPLKVVVYGESAGAHLSSLLAAAAPGECGEQCSLGHPWVKPVGMILQSCQAQFFPWENIHPHIWNVMEDVAGVRYAREPEAFQRLSLCNYIRPGIPQIFWAEAQFEGLFPHYLNEELAKRLAKLGITSYSKSYAGTEHGFFYELKRPPQLEFFDDILHYLKGEVNLIKNLKITSPA